MLILAMDTSAAEGSVALVRSGAAGASSEVLGLRTLSGRHCAEMLLPAVAALIEESYATQGKPELIAVASGPGSFTGLRVAVATAKGLAEVWQTPVVAVSVLQAVAAAAKAEGRVLAVLDAHRNEVFYGEYEFSDQNPARQLQESIAPLTAFAEAQLASAERPLLVTCDAALAARLAECGLPSQLVKTPAAVEFAALGLLHFQNGERADLAALDANYLRRSDAELFSAPKLGIPVK
ncbi:MAG: tRNA (adenosine(37)-N6)-threonylcarbamoyltransferase complex dimerization subunit type 1 TsaB [Acidobacteriota bacterium]|nr:tRNA (adenosine(37)-N6)-threonylcarbamoyltransferase complex dimerization subunit type 1 TsaB [Acidobacteriota bacterium]